MSLFVELYKYYRFKVNGAMYIATFTMEENKPTITEVVSNTPDEILAAFSEKDIIKESEIKSIDKKEDIADELGSINTVSIHNSKIEEQSKIDELIKFKIDPVVEATSRTRPLCIAPGCDKQRKKGLNVCSKHYNENNKQDLPRPATKEELKYTSEALYDLHQTLYITAEAFSQYVVDEQGKPVADLKGLPDKLTDRKEQMIRIYERLINRVGIDKIDQYVNPLQMLLLSTGLHVAETLNENKKK